MLVGLLGQSQRGAVTLCAKTLTAPIDQQRTLLEESQGGSERSGEELHHEGAQDEGGNMIDRPGHEFGKPPPWREAAQEILLRGGHETQLGAQGEIAIEDLRPQGFGHVLTVSGGG